MSSLENKEKLFDIYKNNLKAFVASGFVEGLSKLEDEFYCPICLRGYNRSDLEQRQITLEHIPPKKLGGKARVLTCKTCNNHAGTHLDRDFIDEQNVYDFFQVVPGAKTDAYFIVGDKKLRIEANVDLKQDGTPLWDFVGIPEATNPTHLEAITQSLASGTQEPLSFTFGTYRRRRPNIARLRIAYLMAFSKMGYGLILHPHFNPIRYQILHPEEEILTGIGSLKADFPKEVYGLNIVTSPPELQAFFIIFDTRTRLGQTRTFGIMLPGFSSPGLEIYDNIASKPNLSKGQISLTPLENPHLREAVENDPLFPYRRWNDFAKRS